MVGEECLKMQKNQIRELTIRVQKDTKYQIKHSNNKDLFQIIADWAIYAVTNGNLNCSKMNGNVLFHSGQGYGSS